VHSSSLLGSCNSTSHRGEKVSRTSRADRRERLEGTVRAVEIRRVPIERRDFPHTTDENAMTDDAARLTKL
jgi:hypothetical protein